MKFSCLQENLHKGLSLVNHIALSNSSLPILNNVLLKVEKSTLSLITTNLEIGIRSQVRIKADAVGDFTVPAQLISNYIAFLPNKPVSLEVNDGALLLGCGSHRTKIKGVSAEEFPLLPQIGRNTKYVCRINDLKKGIQQVISAVASDEYRPEISGVLLNFDFSAGRLTMAATDSYRLAEKTISLNVGLSVSDNFQESSHNVIVPTKTLQELLRMLSQPAEENMEMYISENQILFLWEDTEMISRTISGQYPDYKQIIPSEYKTRASVDLGNLAKMIKCAGLFSQSGLNDIRLEFKSSPGKIIVKSVSSQVGENISEMEADVEGEDNEIVFNYRYLLDGLANVGGSEVIFKIIDNNNPGILMPTQEDGYFYIIMPIRQ